jgi:hypothetical protein
MHTFVSPPASLCVHTTCGRRHAAPQKHECDGAAYPTLEEKTQAQQSPQNSFKNT